MMFSAKFYEKIKYLLKNVLDKRNTSVWLKIRYFDWKIV